MPTGPTARPRSETGDRPNPRPGSRPPPDRTRAARTRSRVMVSRTFPAGHERTHRRPARERDDRPNPIRGPTSRRRANPRSPAPRRNEPNRRVVPTAPTEPEAGGDLTKRTQSGSLPRGPVGRGASGLGQAGHPRSGSSPFAGHGPGGRPGALLRAGDRRGGGARGRLARGDGAADPAAAAVAARRSPGPSPGGQLAGRAVPGASAAGPRRPRVRLLHLGTTGRPKAILGRQKGLSHFLAWQRETFGMGGDRAAQVPGLSFDVVLRNVFTALTSGATLCLPAEDDLGPEPSSPGSGRRDHPAPHRALGGQLLARRGAGGRRL